MTPEGKVKRKIKEWFKARGISYAMPMGTGYGTSGVSDFLACWNGRFLAVEAKAPGKRSNTTPLQKNYLHEVEDAGGIAIVVDDVSQLDALEEKLKTQWEVWS